MALHGRNLVYRVEGIPVGKEAQGDFLYALEWLDLETPTAARKFLSDILDNQAAFIRSSENQQAQEFLKAAITFKELLQGRECNFQVFVEIIPSCYDYKRRSALVYFAQNNLPGFLGGTRQNSLPECTVSFGYADLDFSTRFLAMTQLYEPVGVIAAEWVILFWHMEGFG